MDTPNIYDSSFQSNLHDEQISWSLPGIPSERNQQAKHHSSFYFCSKQKKVLRETTVFLVCPPLLLKKTNWTMVLPCKVKRPLASWGYGSGGGTEDAQSLRDFGGNFMRSCSLARWSEKWEMGLHQAVPNAWKANWVVGSVLPALPPWATADCLQWLGRIFLYPAD